MTCTFSAVVDPPCSCSVQSVLVVDHLEGYADGGGPTFAGVGKGFAMVMSSKATSNNS